MLPDWRLHRSKTQVQEMSELKAERGEILAGRGMLSK